jgi:antitoxin FitA
MTCFKRATIWSTVKMIQIRNVPDDLHRALKVRAAREGTTMSELILRELPRIAHQPSIKEIEARIKSRARPWT